MKQLIVLLAALLIALPCTAIAEEGPQVSRAQFCTAIADHEPVDAPETVEVGLQTLYFFNEIVNGSGQTVTHRWYYNDVQIADVALNIGADRWRTWSTKQVWHLAPGTLKVEILDSTGALLAEREIALQ